MSLRKCFIRILSKNNVFKLSMKRQNAVKTNKKQTVGEKYWPLSLIPVYSKFFESFIYHTIFSWLFQKEPYIILHLIFSRSLWFLCEKGISRYSLLVIFQLWELLKCLKGVFVHISEAFNKVNFGGIIHKVEHDRDLS